MRAYLRWLPDALVARLRELSWVRGNARLTYLRLWISRSVGVRRDRLPANLPAAPTILFVCHGNIIRSPMAEALFRRAAAERQPSLSVRSAGTRAVAGRPADPRAVTEAAGFDVNLASHRAQPLSKDLVGQADIIAVMDLLNEAEVVAGYPAASSKVVLLGAFDGPTTLAGAIIPDPYMEDTAQVRQCYRRLVDSTRRFFAAVVGGEGEIRG
jgi:low molecular weight protein-tyrosine phosphatase